jgi:hypothetical protein
MHACRYVYLLMGVLIGSAVVPVAYCLCWKKCSARAAIIGAFSGQWAAIICWLSYTKAVEGSISVDTTGVHDGPPFPRDLLLYIVCRDSVVDTCTHFTCRAFASFLPCAAPRAVWSGSGTVVKQCRGPG